MQFLLHRKISKYSHLHLFVQPFLSHYLTHKCHPLLFCVIDFFDAGLHVVQGPLAAPVCIGRRWLNKQNSFSPMHNCFSHVYLSLLVKCSKMSSPKLANIKIAVCNFAFSTRTNFIMKLLSCFNSKKCLFLQY